MSKLIPALKIKITAKASTSEALLQLLEAHLKEDEALVWVGQPDIEVESKRARNFVMPLIFVLASVALLNGGLATHATNPALSVDLFFKVAMVVGGIAFLLLSLAAWFWPKQKVPFSMRKLYAVTDKRVIRLEPNGAIDYDGQWEWTVESYYSTLHEPKAARIPQAPEYQDITFATESATDGFDYRRFTSLSKEQSAEAVDAINKLLEKSN
ncbi:MAG: hypothetical protein SFY67_04085 [Candidatus Melainabacteria bacterium]|nr:hypothetical protein [Candidatus Melainabacteria bacterium]